MNMLQKQSAAVESRAASRMAFKSSARPAARAFKAANAPTPSAFAQKQVSQARSMNAHTRASRSACVAYAMAGGPGPKKVAIITGASSGLGLNAASALAKTGDWYVILACRDWLKAEKAAQKVGMAKGTYEIMHLDLGAFESVRKFATTFKSSGYNLDALVCNAAVYFPTAETPSFTAEGFEMSVGVNHLGHFLLVQLLLDELKKTQARTGDARCVIVGSVTGNTNTLAGNIPPKADLGNLQGLEKGLGADCPMMDATEFIGAKAYKDSKVCNMLTMKQLHKRLHPETGITFASLYPGCIAETGLFRNHVPLFKKLFPPFQKYITKGYVSEEEAGKRLCQVVSDPKLKQSGVYWSWNNKSENFVNEVSEEVSDDSKGSKLWDLSIKAVGV